MAIQLHHGLQSLQDLKISGQVAGRVSHARMLLIFVSAVSQTEKTGAVRNRRQYKITHFGIR